MFKGSACVHPRILRMRHETVDAFCNYWQAHFSLWNMSRPAAIMKVCCASAPCPPGTEGELGVQPQGRAMIEVSLERLRELALALPRRDCPWESRPTFEPPARPEEVGEFEQVVGFPLPSDLRAFLASVGAVVGMSVHNGFWLGGVERLTQWIADGQLPGEVAGERVAPVATDGGGNAFLLSSGGRVWRWNHETGTLREVAQSFAEFLERVVLDWSAYISDAPGWRFLV